MTRAKPIYLRNQFGIEINSWHCLKSKPYVDYKFYKTSLTICQAFCLILYYRTLNNLLFVYILINEKNSYYRGWNFGCFISSYAQR